MNNALARLGATLSIAVLLVWLYLISEPGPGPAPSPEGPAGAAGDVASGSAVPCAVPLAWRIAELDREFGLSPGEARSAVEDAAALWERAAGARLFHFDPGEGFPIRFVFDERQAGASERQRLEEELRREEDRMEEWRTEMSERNADLRRRRILHDDQVEAFEERLARHNGTVREVNREGGATAAVVEELRRAEESLEEERGRLRRNGEELEAARVRFQEELERFNREVDELNRRSEALERAFPPSRVESGIYRETVLTDRGGVASVSREILIYRFDRRDDLVRVLAHELGHALGLDHVPAPGAIMSESYGEPGGAAGRPSVHPSDLELLGSRCPGL